jgi:hypothetical protein
MIFSINSSKCPFQGPIDDVPQEIAKPLAASGKSTFCTLLGLENRALAGLSMRGNHGERRAKAIQRERAG